MLRLDLLRDCEQDITGGKATRLREPELGETVTKSPDRLLKTTCPKCENHVSKMKFDPGKKVTLLQRLGKQRAPLMIYCRTVQ
eukprot:73645-Amphidinium_carterae.1